MESMGLKFYTTEVTILVNGNESKENFEKTLEYAMGEAAAFLERSGFSPTYKIKGVREI